MDNPKKVWKGIMVTAENNNKYYLMEWDGNSSDIQCTYGRVELTATVISKPYSQWDKIIKEKTGKGYKDVTHTIAEQKLEKSTSTSSQELGKIQNSRVDTFITLMQNYTKNLVSATYSVKVKSVTKAQLEDAQGFITALTKVDRSDEKAVNKILIDLYTVIPRFMTKVPNYLLPNIDFDKTFQQEQDNLDAMASQVALAKDEVQEEVIVEQKTLLDVIGITMDVHDTYNPEIQYLIDQINKTGRNRVKGVFTVDKKTENTKFDGWMNNQKNKQTRILIHGTRCTSVIPILQTNLQIRPQGNFQFSGKAYGDGNYFSETVVKSLGYTGYDTDKILIVYEVHTGNPFVYEGWYRGNSFPLNYRELSSRGYDSTFVNAGNGLLNSEIIAYKEEQCRPKYIIHLQ